MSDLNTQSIEMKKHEAESVKNLGDLDSSMSYSYADYYSWEFDERVELINGKVFTITQPGTKHQQISGAILAGLYNHLKKKPIAVFAAPFDVRFPDFSKADEDVFTVLQPDICVICDAFKLDERGGIGAPDIVVEILLPGDNRKELKNKFEVYEEFKVSEYWIILPGEKIFFRYTLDDDGKYQPSHLLTLGDEVTTPILPGLVLNLDEVFRD